MIKKDAGRGIGVKKPSKRLKAVRKQGAFKSVRKNTARHQSRGQRTGVHGANGAAVSSKSYARKSRTQPRKLTKRQFILLKKIEFVQSMDDRTFRKFKAMPKKKQNEFVYKTLFVKGYREFRPEGGLDQVVRVKRISYAEVAAADSPLYKKALSGVGRKAGTTLASLPGMTVMAAKAMAKEDASQQVQAAAEYVKRKSAVTAAQAASASGKFILTHAPVTRQFFTAISRLLVQVTAFISALLAPLLIPVACLLFMVFFFLFMLGNFSAYYYAYTRTQTQAVSQEVMAYYDTVSKYADKYGIPDFVNLLLAMMMQESGGRGTDPMMCSESPFNTRYPNTVGAIDDPEYSIDVGVQTLVYCLNNAECTEPTDIDGIKLALQDYNFGNGYAQWALRTYGGYTLENANEFAALQAALHGWPSYGDTEYPGDVLRYYSDGSTTSFGLIGENGWCWPSDTTLLTDTFGYQDWRGGSHNGIDIGAGYGSPIYAAAGGTVWIAGYSNSAGNWVVIEHGDGIKTVYMHASELYVSAGQTVSAGQSIAAVGSTGWSTGPHLHFGVMVNSSYNGYDGTWVDPLQYVQAE